MAFPTITSSTAVYVLTVPTVFAGGVQLQGFGPDEAFDTEEVDAAEFQVGVDGTGVAGYVPRAVTQTLTFLASSPSCAVFDQWLAAEDTIQDVIYATGLIRIPSLKLQYAMPQGVFRRPKPISDARRVMMPRRFQIVWLPQPGIPAITQSPLT